MYCDISSEAPRHRPRSRPHHGSVVRTSPHIFCFCLIQFLASTTIQAGLTATRLAEGISSNLCTHVRPTTWHDLGSCVQCLILCICHHQKCCCMWWFLSRPVMNSLQSARPSLPACLKVRSRMDHQQHHHHHHRFPAPPLPSPAGVRWQLHQLPAVPLKSNISVPTKTHYFSCKRKGNSLGHRISHQNEEQKPKTEQDGSPKPCLCTKALAPTVPLPPPSAHPSESNPIKTCGPFYHLAVSLWPRRTRV